MIYLKKKVLIFFITLLIISLFVACSAEKAEQPADSQQTDSYKDVSSHENSGESSNKSNNENDNNEDGEVKSSNEDIPLPKGYPEGLVPIIDGSKISAGGNESLNNGKASVWVTILSSGEPEEVAAFYRNILSSATEKKDEKFAGIYFLEGILEGKEVVMEITEEIFEDGFHTLTSIEISGIDSGEEEKSGSTIDMGKANTGLINEVRIPRGYNKDLVPIIGGSEINSADETEYNGNTAYVLVCYSKEEKEDILEFYKEVLKNAIDIEEGTLSNSGAYTLNGTLDNAKIYLYIGEEDVHEKYKSLYNMTVEILE